MRKGFVAAALRAGALAALVSGCARAPGEGAMLRVWAMGREGEVVQELLTEFERRNPTIRVRVQQLPWTAAHEKLLTAFAGDALPDVAQLGNTWVPEFFALNALERLDERVALSKVIAPADYFPGIWATNGVGGGLYGIPWYVDTRVLFYRKDLLARAGFAHPPRSWSEWRQALVAVKARSGEGYAILLPLNEFEPLLALGLQQDEALLRDGGRRGNFSGDGFRRALAFYVDVFRLGLAPEMSNTQISNVWTEFGRGLFSFYISGPWNIGEFKRRLPDSLQGAWMTAPLPGPEGPGASTAGGSSLVVFRSSKHKEAAWRLIEYLSEPAVQLRFHELTGNLPPRRSAWQDARLASDPYAKAFRDQLERAKAAPAVPQWERIVNEMQLTAERVVREKVAIDEALRDLDRRVDAMLEKRRWMLEREAPR
ncbi:MAG TPA: sugar ABC transporter substrate-binding protein [Usitatibacter sp.]|nr:sugar ABC transporter substrate-binding protein [Usitatibacter sp.]